MKPQYIEIDEGGKKRYYSDRHMTIAHRLDGPAVEYADGSKEWFVNGKLHRTDGPAIEWADGGRAWWLDGKLHRLDGPAIEWADGGRAWWLDGKLHRLDGPAVEYANGSKAWYVDGKRLTEEQFNALTAPTLELTLEDIAAKFGVDVGKIKIVK
jgi:hypothetical protein